MGYWIPTVALTNFNRFFKPCANPKNFEYNDQILGPAAAPLFWRARWRHHPVFFLEHNETNKSSKDTIFL
jgi:hypothetical protein